MHLGSASGSCYEASCFFSLPGTSLPPCAPFQQEPELGLYRIGGRPGQDRSQPGGSYRKHLDDEAGVAERKGVRAQLSALVSPLSSRIASPSLLIPGPAIVLRAAAPTFENV